MHFSNIVIFAVVRIRILHIHKTIAYCIAVLLFSISSVSYIQTSYSSIKPSSHYSFVVVFLVAEIGGGMCLDPHLKVCRGSDYVGHPFLHLTPN